MSGVYRTRHGNWCVKLSINGVRTHFGTFNTREQAQEVAAKARLANPIVPRVKKEKKEKKEKTAPRPAELSQELVRQLFDYDPVTGHLTWKGSPRHNVYAGARAGSRHNKGYRVVGIDYKVYLEHRVIWLYHYGELPDLQIDHINRVRCDNRIENLRLVQGGTPENCQNQGLSKNNTSGCTGVSWNKNAQAWEANIRVNRRIIYLGRSKDKDEAIALRKAAELEYFPFKTQNSGGSMNVDTKSTSTIEYRPNVNYKCQQCGSTEILKDAYAAWDPSTQDWVLHSVYDDTVCNDCGSDDIIEVEYTL